MGRVCTSPLVSGVMDTAHQKINDCMVDYLDELEFIFEKALIGVTGAQMELFDTKIRGTNSHDTVPLIK
jgi:hypothetical protein